LTGNSGPCLQPDSRRSDGQRAHPEASRQFRWPVRGYRNIRSTSILAPAAPTTAGKNLDLAGASRSTRRDYSRPGALPSWPPYSIGHAEPLFELHRRTKQLSRSIAKVGLNQKGQPRARLDGRRAPEPPFWVRMRASEFF